MQIRNIGGNNPFNILTTSVVNTSNSGGQIPSYTVYKLFDGSDYLLFDGTNYLISE